MSDHRTVTDPLRGGWRRQLVRTLGRLAISFASALGLIAAVSGPASAGIGLVNHCLPPTLPTDR